MIIAEKQLSSGTFEGDYLNRSNPDAFDDGIGTTMDQNWQTFLLKVGMKVYLHQTTVIVIFRCLIILDGIVEKLFGIAHDCLLEKGNYKLGVNAGNRFSIASGQKIIGFQEGGNTDEVFRVNVLENGYYPKGSLVGRSVLKSTILIKWN